MEVDTHGTASVKGVDPRLLLAFKQAKSLYEQKYPTLRVRVTDGMRTRDRQAQLVAQGASRTYASKHITGKAIDVAVFEGHIPRWDWPLYREFATIMLRVAESEGWPITWGGHWKTFPDGPHFELKTK